MMKDGEVLIYALQMAMNSECLISRARIKDSKIYKNYIVFSIFITILFVEILQALNASCSLCIKYH